MCSLPLIDQCTNGLHFNHSLWDINDENAFYKDTAEDRLSEVGKAMLNGAIGP